MTKHLREIAFQLENEGFEPGTPDYEWATKVRRLLKCQELHGTLCEDCPAYEGCDLPREYLRDLLLKQEEATHAGAKKA